MSAPLPFDVFLCHNGGDKNEIRTIAEDLKTQGILPWLDEDEIRPGTSWQTALGEQITTIKSAAVFVGESGIGPWQDEEIQAFLSQLKERGCPVIPVVLSSAKLTPPLPWTLKNRHWVDFRNSQPDPIGQLVWGITGEKPAGHQPGLPNREAPKTLREDQDLVPAKDRQVIELRLPGNLANFSDDQKKKLLESLSTLLDVGNVTIVQTIRGSIRVRLSLAPEDAAKVHEAAQEGRLSELGIVETRLYPPIASVPGGEERSSLLILLDRVKEQWVEGVLKHSLYKEVLISLGKHTLNEAVEPPWKQTVEFPEQRRNLTLRDRNIATIFEATGLLLILGEPGSGKTTTLLDLASHLVERAKPDPKERVPVVLNLSSWSKGQSLVHWMTAELNGKYRIPVSIAQSWIDRDYLVPLLDGLDEVRTSLRHDCVAAINEFIDEANPAGLVVCCRLIEYQWLPERLKLNAAICLEPLTAEEADRFLAKGGTALAGLRRSLTIDPVLQDLSKSPLMLSIMSLAYQDGNVEEGHSPETIIDAGASAKERRDQVFSLYVDQMFRRKDASQLFPKEKVVAWLSWLAKRMKEHSQSVFMVEALQPSWLGSLRQRVAYGGSVTSTIGLIIGLLYGPVVGLSLGLLLLMTSWSASRLKSGVLTGLGGGLIAAGLVVGMSYESPLFLYVGLTTWLGLGLRFGALAGIGVGSLSDISLVGKLHWNWRGFLQMGLLGGLFGGLFGGLLSGLIIAATMDVSSGVVVGLTNVPYWGLIGGLLLGIRAGLTDKVKDDRTVPNEGIRLSGKNAAIGFVSTVVIAGLFLGLFSWVTYLALADERVIRQLIQQRIILVLTVGLVLALNRGGSTVLKHYSLRLILWLNGYTPLRFIDFLDYCSKLILLKKVGGGYIFIHRTLLEYFASKDPSVSRFSESSSNLS